MSLQLPRKRTFLAWHRWLGFVATLFLIVLSLTGLALNHTERLQLDQITLRSDWVLQRYGMSGGQALLSYSLNTGDTLSYLDGQIFYNQSPVAGSGPIIGIEQKNNFLVVAASDQLLYLTPEGELIESLSVGQLPFASIQALGSNSEGRSILLADNGTWSTDADWLEFESYTGSYQISPMHTVELSPEQRDRLLSAFQGEGISLYRVLLDLHSGRLFGWGGRTVMDLTAVAILLLITSGLFGYFRKSRRKTI